MRYYILPISLLFGLTSCDSTKKAVESNNTENQTEETSSIVKNSNAIEMEYLDLKVRPQDDFFRFANGNWIDQNPVPPSESRWGSFNELEISNNKNATDLVNSALDLGFSNELLDENGLNNIGYKYLIADKKEDTPIRWIHRNDRFFEKLSF